MAEVISEKVKVIWLARCPGGPIRLLGFAATPSESKVKEAYFETFTFKGSRAKKDVEMPWPVLEIVERSKAVKDFSHLLQINRRTARPRAYREFLEIKGR